MTVKSGQAWSGLFNTLDNEHYLYAATGTPVGVLYVNGVSNAAAVTVTGANPYKFAVTLPALTAGDTVSLYVTATIDGVTTGAVVAEEIADTSRVSDVATTIGAAGGGLTAVPWNAAWDAQVESEVDDALGGGTGTALTAIPWNAVWDAEVQSEATDALNAYDPPTKAEVDAALLVIRGADSDTLETLSDQLDGVSQPGAAMALTAAAVDAILDEVVEGTLTMRQMLRLFAAFMLNKASGGGTTTITFRDVGNTKARITMTVNSTTGDRTNVVLDGS